jgi:hypothetical protein
MRLYAAAGVLLCAGVAHAGPPEIYPLAKVQRGQTAYANSTIAGTTPERFTFEVVSVVHNFLAKQDIILIKSEDPKLAVTGIWAGMSGSPLYIDDKLACAISYNFRFNKTTLGGCTPLEYMKKEGEAFRRQAVVPAGKGAPKTVQPAAASLEDWRRLTPTVDAAAAMTALGAPHKSWLLSAPLPMPAATPDRAIDGQAMTASVPLSVAGFSAPAFSALEKLFGGSDLTPMRAGGTGGPTTPDGGPKAFQMGGSIAVELIRGDMSAAAIGTVTYIDRDKVLAFGHPMFQSGETYAPVSTVYVHTIVASLQNSFVVGSAVNEVGSLVQDRQAAIVADTSLRSRMVPVDISIVTTSGAHVDKGTFHVELLDNKFMTPSLAGSALQNAVGYYLPDHEDVTARIESSVRVKGQQPIEFVDYLYANDGAGSIMGAVRGLRVLVPLMLNPFEPVEIEHVDIKVDLRFAADFGELKEVRVPNAELVAGKRNMLQVRMSTWDGKDILEDVPVEVPANLAGSIVQLDLSSGDAAKLDAAPPVDLKSLLAAFRKLLPGNVWAVSLYPADEGVAVEGKLVRDLPASALDKLHPQSHTQRAAVYKPIARTIVPAKRVVNGSSSMLVRVRAATDKDK